MRQSCGAVFSPLLVFACVPVAVSAVELYGGLLDGSWSISLVYSADWAMRWIGSDATFGERLVAFAAVEVRIKATKISWN